MEEEVASAKNLLSTRSQRCQNVWNFTRGGVQKKLPNINPGKVRVKINRKKLSGKNLGKNKSEKLFGKNIQKKKIFGKN